MSRLHSFLVLASAGSKPENLSIFDPASPSAVSTRFLFYLVIAISAAIFLLVEGVLLYSLLRFGKRPPDSIEPPQVYGSMPIEIAWTAAPALIVFLLALILARTEFEVKVNPDRPPPDSEPLYVTVIGHQWWWEYVYSKNYRGKPTQFITANELHMPASDDGVARPVYLALQSVDVCHSFWIPRLAGKTDLIPGRKNQMWFQTSEAGLFLGQCAEYCGSQHAHMLLRVVVDSPAVFDTWLEGQRKPAVDDEAVRAGRDAFLSQSCVNCHRVRGTGAKGAFGPDLTHLMTRQTLASGMIPNTREELRKWLVDPQKIKPSCLMPAFGLSDKQVDLIVSYLASLK
jgi:cytochrome c oxidase subunit 2